MALAVTPLEKVQRVRRITGRLPLVLPAIAELGLDLDRYFAHTDGEHVEFHCHTCAAWGNGLVLALHLDTTLEPLTTAAAGHECSTDTHRLIWTHVRSQWRAECLCGWKAERWHTTYPAGEAAYAAHPPTKGRHR